MACKSNNNKMYQGISLGELFGCYAGYKVITRHQYIHFDHYLPVSMHNSC